MEERKGEKEMREKTGQETCRGAENLKTERKGRLEKRREKEKLRHSFKNA